MTLRARHDEVVMRRDLRGNADEGIWAERLPKSLQSLGAANAIYRPRCPSGGDMSPADGVALPAGALHGPGNMHAAEADDLQRARRILVMQLDGGACLSPAIWVLVA